MILITALSFRVVSLNLGKKCTACRLSQADRRVCACWGGTKDMDRSRKATLELGSTHSQVCF